MLNLILPVMAPILLCVLVGYLWALLKQPYDTQLVSRLVMTVGAPALIIATLATTHVSKGLMLEMVYIAGTLLAGFAVSGLVLLRLFRLDIRSFLGPLMFPNVGNIGLPFCLYAFGEKGLALALALFMMISLAHFSIGIMLVSGGSFIKQLVTNPIIYSVAAAMAMIFFDFSLPAWAFKALDLLASFTIPLMLITLGVSLASLKITHVGKSTLLAVLRLAIGVGMGLLVCIIFDLKGVQRGVVLVQAAMPTAVFNYLFASQYNRNPQVVAGMVVISTLMGFCTLPVLLHYLV